MLSIFDRIKVKNFLPQFQVIASPRALLFTEQFCDTIAHLLNFKNQLTLELVYRTEKKILLIFKPPLCALSQRRLKRTQRSCKLQLAVRVYFS